VQQGLQHNMRRFDFLRLIAKCDTLPPRQFFHLGGQTLSMRMRVPSRVNALEQREEVWISPHTDSETVAKAPKVWSDMIEAWEAMLDGMSRRGRKAQEGGA
jgi:hypothetical protein